MERKTRKRRHFEMAYYTQTQTHSVVERLLERTSELFHAAAKRYARARIYRTSLNELNALSDRDLADLGLHRSEIKALAFKAAMEHAAQ
jgi:uncharacterized protein YjiS (DUF1127 family)